MDKTNKQPVVRNGIKILLWLVFLVFFIYSFQTIMDFEWVTEPYHTKLFIRVLTALTRPDFLDGETFHYVVVKMWETFQIAFLATTISAILALPLTLFSARPSSRWGRGFNIFLQPLLSIVRAVHPLIVTIPAVVLAGLGPTTGVLALTFFSTAVLIGTFSEYASEHRSLNWINLSKNHFPALAFKQLPRNILIATILGFMGGGGIGFLLHQQFNLLEYQDVSVSLLAIIIVIGGIDLISRFVWRNIKNNAKVMNLD